LHAPDLRPRDRVPAACLTAALVILAGSLVLSRDRFTWVLETFPVLLGLPVLVLTYRRFRFSDWMYAFLVLHTLILSTGGVYTYAQVPLGFWLQEWFGFARNHFDRIGHFAQGFIPAMLARELLLRTSPLRRGRWLTFLTLATCLAISALYELIEAAAAIGMGATADAFLGSQGDRWDAQYDMVFALIGAATYLASLTHAHDRYLPGRHVA
jgi:putative membrane protein